MPGYDVEIKGKRFSRSKTVIAESPFSAAMEAMQHVPQRMSGSGLIVIKVKQVCQPFYVEPDIWEVDIKGPNGKL